MADLSEDFRPIPPSGESRRTAPLEEICGLAIAPGGIAVRICVDPAKAFVMAYLSQLVAGGHADWNMLDDGDIKLKLHSGETFILRDETILRVA